MAQVVTADQMLERMEAVQPLQVITEAIVQTIQTAEEKNREQLFQGVKADGTRLRPYKPGRYAKLKAVMNPRTADGIPDFKFTGDLYAKLRGEVKGEDVVFSSSSDHAVFMERRDGEEIFGLTDESKEEYQEVVTPVAIESIKDKTGLQ